MPVPMMLAITIEHAVTKPMVRLGGTDLAEAGCASVVILRKFYSTFLLQNAEHPKFNAQDQSATIGCRKSAARARGALGTNLNCRAVLCNPP
jgi:hypothetical protein